jgi:hypothetical protein
MSAPEYESLSDDELISAYLDEDLGPAEMARAEELLAHNPESRKLLDDLKSQRSMLAAMPRESLGEDFAKRTAERAQRAAEREVLVGSGRGPDLAATLAAAAAMPPPSAEQEDYVVPARTPFTWERARRPIAYAAVALAAGLMLMLIPGSEKPPQVAQVAHQLPSTDGEIGAARGTSPPGGMAGSASMRATSEAATASNLAAPATAPAVAPTSPAAAGSVSNAVELRPGDADEVREMLRQYGFESLTDDVLAQTSALAREASNDEKQPVFLSPGLLIVEVDVKPSEWKAKEFEEVFSDNAILVDAATPESQEKTTAATADAVSSRMKAAANDRQALDVMCVVAPDGRVNQALDQWKNNRDVVVQSNSIAVPSPEPATVQENAAKRSEGRAQRLDVSKFEIELNQTNRQRNAAAAETPASEPQGATQENASQRPVYQRALVVIRAAETAPPAKGQESATPSAPVR